MNDPNVYVVLTMVLTVVISLVAIFIAWRNHGTVNLEGVVSSVESSVPLAQEISEVARIAVESAEQMKREGKLQTNDEALNYAIDVVQKWFPDTQAVSNEKIITAINAAILTASLISNQIEQAKAVQNDSGDRLPGEF